jgi:hypothetical protein
VQFLHDAFGQNKIYSASPKKKYLIKRKGETNMKKEKLITRTFVITQATVMALNIETAEPSTETYEMLGIYKTDEELLKAVKELYDTDTEKVVAITAKTEIEELRGISESLFLQHSIVLPAREKKEA